MRRNAGFGVNYTRNTERSEWVAGRPQLIVKQRFSVSGLTPYAVTGCHPLTPFGGLLCSSFYPAFGASRLALLACYALAGRR